MTKAENFRKLTCTQHIRADLRASSVRAAVYSGVSSAFDFVLRIGSTAILARLVLPEHFGLVMMVTAVTAIADQFRDLGLSTATVQKVEISHEEVTNLFWVNALVGAIITLVICATSPLVSIYYREPRLTLITCALATNFLFGGLMVQHQALLTRQLKMGYTSAIRLSASTVSTLLAVLLAWKGYGYWALVWREVARSALLAAGMWLCCPWVPGLPDRKTDIRGLISFGTNLTAANILTNISSSVDRLLLGRFWGPVPVAMYRQAYQLIVIPIDQLVGPVWQVSQPGLSMLQSADVRYRRFYQKVVTLVCIGSMPLSLFIAVYSSEVTQLVLGRKWVDSAPILLILSFGAFIKQAVGSAAWVLITRGHSKTYFGLTLLNSTTLILLMFAGARWGAIGVAVADVAATYSLIAPRLHYSFKGSPITIGMFFSAIFRPATAGVVMAFVLMIFRLALPPMSLVVSLACGGTVALAAFFGTWILMPSGKAELIALILDLKSALRGKSPRVG